MWSGRKIKVRRQEMAEEVKCFRYWKREHYKWKCLNIEKRRRSKEEAVYMARPQKVQQRKRPVYSIWKKVQKYCRKENIPPKGTLLLERGWIIRVMATYMDCKGYEDKGVLIYKNQEQEFFLERQVRNVQYSLYQEVQN